MTGATLETIFLDGEAFVEKSADDIAKRVLRGDRARPKEAAAKDHNTIATSRILNGWKGSTLAEAVTAAFELGLLAASTIKPEPQAKRVLQMWFSTKLDNKHWPTVENAFLEGCKVPIGRDEMIRALDGAPVSTISPTPHIWKPTPQIPRQQFLYGKHLIRGYLTVDAATTGVGKSTHMIADVLSMVTGRSLLGVETGKPLNAWLWNGEDPKDEIERRVAAACGHHGVSEAAIGGRLYLNSGRDMPIVVAKEEKGATTINAPIISAVKQAIVLNNIDVFSVDPFVTTHGVSENDNTRMAVVAGQWAQIAHETQCAIHLVHHIRKGEGGEVTVEDMRGAGSLASTARAVRLLSPMTLDDAKAAGIKPTDRYRYFRVTNGKSNLSPRGGAGEWRQLVSHPMGNQQLGNFVGEPQDFVAVAAKWSWPSAASLIENVTAEQLFAIKANMRGGKRENAQSLDWAGHAVARILEMDMDDPGEKDTVKRMLKAWITAGHMKTEMQLTEKREMKKFILPAEPQ